MTANYGVQRDQSLFAALFCMFLRCRSVPLSNNGRPQNLSYINASKTWQFGHDVLFLNTTYFQETDDSVGTLKIPKSFLCLHLRGSICAVWAFLFSSHLKSCQLAPGVVNCMLWQNNTKASNFTKNYPFYRYQSSKNFPWPPWSSISDFRVISGNKKQSFSNAKRAWALGRVIEG